MRPDRAHNDYLNLLADWGTTGGIIVAAGVVIFGTGLAKTWKAVRPDKNELGRGMSNRFAFFVGASSSLLALAAHSVIDYNLHTPANALVGVFLLALLTGQLRLAAAGQRIDARAPARIFAVIILAGGMVYFSLQGYRCAEETYWLRRAANPAMPILDRTALMEKAFAADPENFQTTYGIAELYQLLSLQGGQDYQSLAKTAMDWYSRGMKLNPYDGYNYLGYGKCLDWLDRHDEAEPYFSRAEALDPNGYYTVVNIGCHYIDAGDYPAARPWLERSIRLETDTNPIGYSYWEIVQDRLTQNATGKSLLPLGY